MNGNPHIGAHILVVEDETPIRRLLRTTLAAQGFDMAEAGTAAQALDALRAQAPDLILLDLGLPDRDGLDLIAEIRRASAVPILVLSSRGDERSKVAALDGGADDYVTKPFGAAELMARVRTALRHRLQEQGATPLFRSGVLSVDLVHRRVLLGGVAVHLSPKEYAILQELVIHAGKVLTHKHLLNTVWGSALEADVQYLRVYVRQLRQKIESKPEQPALILTEPGVGYRLQTD
jgi:two-component system KDP operon response regulator KdpE